MANTTEDFEKQRGEQVANIRSVLDYLLSIAFIVIGIVCIVRFRPDTVAVIFGVVAILYGVWRGVKGFRKNRTK